MRLLFTKHSGGQNPFDLTREPERIRDLYGREEWGQGLLGARRLVEASVRIVQVNGIASDLVAAQRNRRGGRAILRCGAALS